MQQSPQNRGLCPWSEARPGVFRAVLFLCSFFPVDPSVFSPFGPFRHSRLRRSRHLPLNKGRHWAGCIRSGAFGRVLSVGGIALAPLVKGRQSAGCLRSGAFGLRHSVGGIALAPLAKGRHWAGGIRSVALLWLPLSRGGIGQGAFGRRFRSAAFGRGHCFGSPCQGEAVGRVHSVGCIALAPLAKGSCHREPRRTMTEGSHAARPSSSI